MVKKLKLSATILILVLLISCLATTFTYKKAHADTLVDYEKSDLSLSYQFELKSDGYYIVKYLGNERSIELPDYYNGIPVTGIADVAYGEKEGVFYDRDILQVKLGKNIKYLGRGAFRECDSLEKVIFNDSLETINSYAFYNCSSLDEFDFPKLKKLGHDTLNGTGWYNKISNQHKNLNSAQEDYYYQNEHNKILVKVRKIVSDSYTVEDGTTLIAQQAFLSSLPLSKLTLPTSVKYLGNYLLGSGNTEFNENYNIDYVNCQITIKGSTLEEFSKSVVFGQSSFALVGTTYSPTQNANAKYIGKALVSSDKNFVAEDFAVVEGTTQIAEAAFASTLRLKKITIPESVTYIGKGAFSNCKNLTEVVIQGQVEIDDNAFSGCSSLKTISGKIKKVGVNAFTNCSALESIDLSSVEIVKEQAFMGATKLESVTIADTAKVYASAFDGTKIVEGKTGQIFVGNHLIRVTSEVTSLDLTNKSIACYGLVGSNIESANLTGVTLGDGAFFGCEKLTSVNYDGTEIPKDCFNGATKLETLNASVTKVGEMALQNTAITSFDFTLVEEIGEFAFSGSKLAQADLNASVIIEDYAFFGASLTAISVDSANPLYSSQDGILYDKEKIELLVYPANKQGQTLELGAKIIGKGAFSYSKNLTSISGEITQIKEDAFYGSSVTSISADKVTTIGDKAFYDSSIQSLNLPKLTSAGYKAFAYSKLISIKLTNTSFNRDLALLKGASNLTDIDISFNYDSSDEMTLNLGYLFGADYFEGSQAGYQKYSDMGAIVYFVPKVERVTVTDGKVAVGAFMNMKNLKSVTLAEGVLGLGSSAFSGCESLTCVNFNGGVNEIGKECFSGCENLATINLSGVKRVGDFAFKGCTSLNQLKVYDCLVYIGNGAFSECEGLTSVQIESQAFLNNYDIGQTDFGLLFDNATSVTVGAKELTQREIKDLREIKTQTQNKISKTKIITIVAVCLAVVLVAVYFVARFIRAKHTEDYTRSKRHHKRH